MDALSQQYGVDVGWERFLAPEIFFNPEIASSDFLTPLPEVVDQVIQSSPIDVRRGLYKNIVLSGGSTMFKNFSQRLKRDLKNIVDQRVALSESLSGGSMKVGPPPPPCSPSPAGQRTDQPFPVILFQSSGVEVNVISHSKQRYAVWYGGSMMASLVRPALLLPPPRGRLTPDRLPFRSPTSTRRARPKPTTRSTARASSGGTPSLAAPFEHFDRLDAFGGEGVTEGCVK